MNGVSIWRGVILFCLVVFSRVATAQLCQGSLGDPLINITFGQGVNPGPPLSAATTAYQFVSTDCPNDGFYTVRTNTTSCFSGSWHSLSADHTGDPNGYFMLVNASFQPGAFYIDTVRGLCERTTYELAAWIINVLQSSSCSGNGIKPNISFSVERTDGTVIQTYNTGDIASFPAPQWNKFGFFFTTPVGVSNIVLRLVNNAPGGCGNDLGIDDITFRACGPTITNRIDGNAVSDAGFCEGVSKQYLLNAQVSAGFTTPVYQWQTRIAPSSIWTDVPLATNTSTAVIFPANSPPGLYQYRLAVAEAGNMGSPQCRVYSQPFSITVYAKPQITVSNTGPYCEKENGQLNVSGGNTYQWNGPGGFTATGSTVALPSIQRNQAGKYYVDVTTVNGCTGKDSTLVIVNARPVAAVADNDLTICEGNRIQLQASGGTRYEWIPATGLSSSSIANPNASPVVTTVYNVIVTNPENCHDTTAVTVDVNPKPQVNAGPDKIIFTGESVQLNGMATSGDTYLWSPPEFINDVNTLTPVVTPPLDQEYILTVTSALGCGSVSDRVLVKVFRDIFVPTAFTPNNNAKNDTWNVLGLGAVKSFSISVFDRWGERIFYTKDVVKGWDGRYKGSDMPAGIYIYYIVAGTRKLKGTFMLIRD